MKKQDRKIIFLTRWRKKQAYLQFNFSLLLFVLVLPRWQRLFEPLSSNPSHRKIKVNFARDHVASCRFAVFEDRQRGKGSVYPKKEDEETGRNGTRVTSTPGVSGTDSRPFASRTSNLRRGKVDNAFGNPRSSTFRLFSSASISPRTQGCSQLCI